MNDEAAVCATAFFRTIGRDVTTPDDFVMRTSLEMKWLPPSDAKVLLAYLVDEGAVIRKDAYIRPSPELGDVDVPLAYRPSKGRNITAKSVVWGGAMYFSIRFPRAFSRP